ncbi:MAG: HAD family phosphatase [Proteobacteria bacterium]|nr:HAD family phosphatase [Pseudomonadota bacterium]
MKPLPLSQLPAQNIKAVFSDLDDTLTDDSLILPQTLQSLHELHHKGFKLVIVSGRPAGWADALMRLIPLDAVIFENGAGMMWREGKKICTHCLAENKNLNVQKTLLQKLFDQIRAHIPEAKLATDQPYRLFDYALDFNEEPPLLKPEQIDWVMSFLEKQPEITAKLSSIHINYWVGKHTKLTACQFWLDRFGSALSINSDSIVYSGDSPNDEPLFGFFPNSVGVANVSRFLSKMKSPPKYITPSEGGKGFQELAYLLLQKGKP